MKESDIQFNGEYLRELILRHFGLTSIKDFCIECGISRPTLYHWFNGRRGGPRPDSMAKIIDAFAKKGIILSVSDFYISKKDRDTEHNSLHVSKTVEPLLSRNEQDKEDALKTNNLIAEKNQIIVDQYQQIISLQKEIEQLKRLLKKK